MAYSARARPIARPEWRRRDVDSAGARIGRPIDVVSAKLTRLPARSNIVCTDIAGPIGHGSVAVLSENEGVLGDIVQK